MGSSIFLSQPTANVPLSAHLLGPLCQCGRLPACLRKHLPAPFLRLLDCSTRDAFQRTSRFPQSQKL